MHGGGIRFALSAAVYECLALLRCSWPWPEKPPWVSKSVVRLLKALPEAAGRRDRRGTVLTLPVFCSSVAQTVGLQRRERHIEPPPPSPALTHRGGREPRRRGPSQAGNAPGIQQSPLAGTAPGGQWRRG